MLLFKRAPDSESIDDTGRSNRVRSPAGGVSDISAVGVVPVIGWKVKFPVLA